MSYEHAQGCNEYNFTKLQQLSMRDKLKYFGIKNNDLKK